MTFWSPNGAREIVHEKELRLLDRAFQLGDYCKRSFDDLQSGVIIDVKVKSRFEHAISHEDVPGWFTTEDLKEKTVGEIGDYVAYDDWIGQVSSFNELRKTVSHEGQIVEVRINLSVCSTLINFEAARFLMNILFNLLLDNLYVCLNSALV